MYTKFIGPKALANMQLDANQVMDKVSLLTQIVKSHREIHECKLFEASLMDLRTFRSTLNLLMRTKVIGMDREGYIQWIADEN
jgi:hypothetical protein